jgi:hypothetical protein
MRAEDGGLFQIETGDAVQAWIERQVIEPKDRALLAQISLADARPSHLPRSRIVPTFAGELIIRLPRATVGGAGARRLTLRTRFWEPIEAELERPFKTPL